MGLRLNHRRDFSFHRNKRTSFIRDQDVAAIYRCRFYFFQVLLSSSES